MNGWKKINVKDMKKITGGGFWVTLWTLSLATLVISRSVFSEKASVTLNGVGRASWEDKETDGSKTTNKTIDETKKNGLTDLETFYTKFYEV